MLPSGKVARKLLMAVLTIAFVAGIVLVRYSLTPEPSVSRKYLEAQQLEEHAAALRAATVVAHAAEARAATRPALARAESLRSRVTIESSGALRVQNADGASPTSVPVPPLVTERIEADSAAISSLSVALTWDSRAMAAQEERLVAETKVSDAARLKVAALERERSPRCGRRCGMVLGAASIVALGIAVDQTRRLVSR